MSSDERRTARLLLDGAGPEAAVTDTQALRRAVRSPRVSPAPVRLGQALAMKRGRLSADLQVRRAAAARIESLGAEVSAEPPRLLVRMDEFPHARAFDDPGRYGDAAFERFQGIMSAAGVPYLLAVTPRPCHSYLDPSATGDRPLSGSERELLAAACAEGAEPAVHGLTHRTLDPRPRHHSELHGLSPAALRDLLARADEELGAAGVHPRVFVPPFNRFDRGQLPVLAERFDVVCGGPESVALLGFRAGPSWWGETVYLPSYPPLYGRAAEIEPVLATLEGAAGAWVPVTLHMGWEADDGWTALERLADAMAPHAWRWSEFLAAVARSREG